jgi:hypothetical protein
LISGISKNAVFFSFLFVNFIQPLKSAELSKINKIINDRNIKTSLPNISHIEISSNSQNNSLNSYLEDHVNYVKFLKTKTNSWDITYNFQEKIIWSSLH